MGREGHPPRDREYTKWSPLEESLVMWGRKYLGFSISEIAVLFKRSNGAIRDRLRKLEEGL